MSIFVLSALKEVFILRRPLFKRQVWEKSFRKVTPEGGDYLRDCYYSEKCGSLILNEFVKGFHL